MGLRTFKEDFAYEWNGSDFRYKIILVIGVILSVFLQPRLTYKRYVKKDKK